ncbi:MAG TPA: metallophosphoesterase [Gemmataceae bacterium]|nr:metallophosphoesterase [Gemmataceae bacterium]
MKRLLLVAFVFGLLLAAVGLSRSTPQSDVSADAPLQVSVESRNPWTHLRLNRSSEQFQFAIVSDRTGGHRAGIFSRAVELINLMQPEFVLSVGDLIEGYTTAEKARTQWREFQSYVCKLQMPFFYAPGNHDALTPDMAKVWQEKFGRRYYHFVYKNVLFLVLNTYDGPEIDAKGGKKNLKEQFSKEQLDYVKQVLAENQSIRWTVVALHPPIWTRPDVAETGWLEVEKLLAGRNYTVFCGHIHHFRKYVRQGMNYYQLATTGGGSSLRGIDYGEFDHITWVTMKADGPVLAHLLLDGIYPEDLKKPITEETGTILGDGKAVTPVSGKVFYRGSPAVGAEIVFRPVDAATKKRADSARGRVEADGSFRLTTYRAFDGAVAGEHRISIVWHPPLPANGGERGANRLPERYARPETSKLTATVEAGGRNEFVFELTE